MQELSYWDLLNPEPISFPFGTLRKPTLSEIASISMDKYLLYEILARGDVRLIREMFFGGHKDESGEASQDGDGDTTSVYELILQNESVRNLYTEVLNFFIVEEVIFYDGYFVILTGLPEDMTKLSSEFVRGAIGEESFPQLLAYIQQICCMYEREEEPIEQQKFKSKLAEKLYRKMRKASEEQEKRKAKLHQKEYSLANIISAVSNFHPSLSPIQIWKLTKFQLVDSFNRLQSNAIYNITWTRTAVWGDEKNQFDSALWYKNNHDK